MIVKLGGSLLDLPDVVARMSSFLERQLEPAVVIAGGGAAADVVRGWFDRFGLSEAAAHQLAMRSLSLTARLLETLDARFTVGGDRVAAATVQQSGGWPVLDLVDFVEGEATQAGPRFPHSWAVTTDSLAAWTAIRWPDRRLVLAKSIPCPSSLSLDEAVRAGCVDEYFSQLAPLVPRIEWINLRDESPSPASVPWLSYGKLE